MPEPTDPSQANDGARKLQAIGFGEILDTIFSLYRTHFLSLLGIASGYFMTIAIVISIVFLATSAGWSVRASIWVPIVIGVFVGLSLFVVSRLVFAGAEACLGNTIGVGAVLRQGRQQFLPYFIGSLLFGIITILCVFVSGFVLGLLMMSYIRSTIGTGGVEVGTVNFILRILVPLLMVGIVGFFITYWSFFVSATLLEGTSMRVGFRRSRELISGRRWRVMGTVIAIFLLAFAIGFILRTVFAFLLVLIGLEGVGNFLEVVQWMALWELPTQLSELRLSYALMYLINSGIDTFTIPIWVIGFTRLYFDQRIRKEGFDIEVMVTHRGE